MSGRASAAGHSGHRLLGGSTLGGDPAVVVPATFEEFYEMHTDLPTGDSTLVQEVLGLVGYTEQEGLKDVAADIESLGVDGFLASLPKELGVRQKAAAARFAKHMGTSTGLGPEQHTVTTDSHLLRQVLRVVGGPTDPQAEEQERLNTKATVGRLAEELQLGTFAPLLLPGKDVLTKVTTAAQLGHFPEPDQALLAEKHCRPFAQGLLTLLQSGVAALMQHRLTPAALLSELGLALELALEPRLAAEDAQRVALTYTFKVRKLLHDASLNTQLEPEKNPAAFAAAMQVFLRRDSGLYSDTKESLGVTLVPVRQVQDQGGRAVTKAASAKGDGINDSAKSKLFCVRFGVRQGLCSCPASKPCPYEHSCPFCKGAACQNQAGYIAKHLGSLKKPLVIVDKSSEGGAGKASRRSRSRRQGSHKGGRERRSRSRSASRRRPRAHSPDRSPAPKEKAKKGPP